MDNLATVASQVGILFALMGVGSLCRRFRLIDARSVKGIVNVLLMVVTPCLIVSVFQRPFDRSMMYSFAPSAIKLSPSSTASGVRFSIW